jgi:PPOX class probable F420-dependent enzyme
VEERVRDYLERNRSAAMITLRPDGTPHAVRVGVALVDGKLWSSGVPTRVRTRNLRRDPRSTLFVFGANGPTSSWSWLTLEATVTILDGPDAPEQSVRLFRVMQSGVEPAPPPGKLLWNGQEKSEEEFRRIMRDDQRLIYEFEVQHTYGTF